MKRLWDGLDPGTFTSTTEAEEQGPSVRDDDREAMPGRSAESKNEDGAGQSGSDHANGKQTPSTLLGLPEDADAGEVILVNKRDIMVLQFVVVRLVEKGILDAEEVIRMKKEANKEIRNSHPDVAGE